MTSELRVVPLRILSYRQAMVSTDPEGAAVMTLQEMEQVFDSEWILVGNPETDATMEVIKGTVLCHSKDRDAVYREAVRLRPKHSAIVYTGEMPPDTAIVL